MAEDDANLTSRALTDLQIVPETVQAADPKTRNRYHDAVKFGNLPCAYTKVMFLGDSGVGKTSTRKLLMGERHDVRDGQSTFGIDKYVVDDSFKTVDPSSDSELEKAAAYFTIHGTSNLLTQVPLPFYIVIIRRLWLALGIILVFSLGIILFCFRGLVLGFTPILLIATAATSMLLKNIVTGFNIGNGVAVVLIFTNFITSGDFINNYLLESDGYTILIIAAMAISGYATGFVLALGTGAGLCMALSFMIPPVNQTPSASVEDTKVILQFEMDDFRRGGQALVLVTFMLVGILVQSKVDSRKLNFAIKSASLALVFAISRNANTWVLLAISGTAFGIAFVTGQQNGRRMSKIFKIGHVNRTFTDFFGIEIGIIAAYYIGWKFPTTSAFKSHFALAVVGIIACVLFELRRWYVATRDNYPVDLVRRQIRDNKQGKWPLRYCLLDCAGNELYHLGHHIFMAKHSVYLIVFSLEDAYLRPDWQLQRLLYWLNSVFSHARHRDSLVFLVGTFKASIETQQIDSIGRWLSDELHRSFAGRLALNETRKHNGRNLPLFVLENCFRIHNQNCQDLDQLQNQIKKKVSEAEYVSRPVPLKWFGFYDFILKCRNQCQQDAKNQTHSCVYDFYELYESLKEICSFQEQAEYFRMLQFYADFGEIFFKPNDARLFRYVVLDPKILIDCVEALAGKLTLECDPYLEFEWEQLERTGTATREVVLNMIEHVPGDKTTNIKLLQSLELLIPVKQQDIEIIEDFIVPFRLPLQIRSRDSVTFGEFFFFDFGCFYPEVIFMYLMAKCHQITRLTTELDGVRISNNDFQYCKDSGMFYFGESLVYKVQLKRPSPYRNLIKVSVCVLESKVTPLRLYRHLDEIVDFIRKRDFEFLTYECGVLCHCLDGDDERDNFHLNVISRHGTTDDLVFPKSGQQKFMCRGIPRVIEFPSEILENEMVGQEMVPPETDAALFDGLKFDAFVSCARDDRAWVQCELLPVLENVESPFREVGFFQKQTVSVKVNYTENPNPNMNKLSLLEMNARDIVSCKSAIVVISRDYLNDARCMKELNFIVTRTKMVIPIIKDGCRCPDVLKNIKCVDYETARKDGALLGMFYLPVILAVKQAQ